MKDYIFCGVVDVATVFCIAWLGYLVWNGATSWLIVVMLILALVGVYPGNDIFTCPKCGHHAKMKTLRTKPNTPAGFTPENKQWEETWVEKKK